MNILVSITFSSLTTRLIFSMSVLIYVTYIFTDCSSLYRYIPQHKMDKARGDFEVSVEVEHTDDPTEQRVNISWSK